MLYVTENASYVVSWTCLMSLCFRDRKRFELHIKIICCWIKVNYVLWFPHPLHRMLWCFVYNSVNVRYLTIISIISTRGYRHHFWHLCRVHGNTMFIHVDLWSITCHTVSVGVVGSFTKLLAHFLHINMYDSLCRYKDFCKKLIFTRDIWMACLFSLATFYT